jgi:hypothetical protein
MASCWKKETEPGAAVLLRVGHQGGHLRSIHEYARTDVNNLIAGGVAGASLGVFRPGW